MKINCKKGYTLVEMIIYILILTLLSIIVIQIILVLSKSFISFKANRNILMIGEIVNERIIREIRLSNSIDIINSTLNSNPGKLVLNTKDSDNNNVTISFYILSNQVVVEKEGETAAPITPDDMEISNLIFRNITTSSSEAVKTEISLSIIRGGYSKSNNFYSTVVLRGSY